MNNKIMLVVSSVRFCNPPLADTVHEKHGGKNLKLPLGSAISFAQGEMALQECGICRKMSLQNVIIYIYFLSLNAPTTVLVIHFYIFKCYQTFLMPKLPFFV
jgi:hypothetical protein